METFNFILNKRIWDNYVTSQSGHFPKSLQDFIEFNTSIIVDASQYDVIREDKVSWTLRFKILKMLETENLFYGTI